MKNGVWSTLPPSRSEAGAASYSVLPQPERSEARGDSHLTLPIRSKGKRSGRSSVSTASPRSPVGRTTGVGIANGYHGHLPTPLHHWLGGCETWLGTDRVQEDASVLITDQPLEMMRELNK